MSQNRVAPMPPNPAPTAGLVKDLPAGRYSNKRWCCGDMDHMDLSVWAFEKLADKKWGMIGIQVAQLLQRKRRSMPCTAHECRCNSCSSADQASRSQWQWLPCRSGLQRELHDDSRCHGLLQYRPVPCNHVPDNPAPKPSHPTPGQYWPEQPNFMDTGDLSTPKVGSRAPWLAASAAVGMLGSLGRSTGPCAGWQCCRDTRAGLHCCKLSTHVPPCFSRYGTASRTR